MLQMIVIMHSEIKGLRRHTLRFEWSGLVEMVKGKPVVEELTEPDPAAAPDCCCCPADGPMRFPEPLNLNILNIFFSHTKLFGLVKQKKREKGPLNDKVDG